MMFGVGETFEYSRCEPCGTLWLEDPPGDLSAYYPTDYYSAEIDPEHALGRRGIRHFAYAVARSAVLGSGHVARTARTILPQRQLKSFVTLLEAVRLARPSGTAHFRVLDVGCGSGVITYALGLIGLTSVGIDPYVAQDRFFDNGAKVLRRQLADTEGVFDVVMFHHSLEHVEDPLQSLKDALGVLAPHGRILVRIPTVSSTAYETYGTDWVQLDAPRHITLFSRDGFAQLAKRAGLQVVDVVDDSSAFQFWGSEQVRAGTPLMAPTSHMIDAKASAFTAAQIRAWDREANALNRQGRGDQAVWVLTRASVDGQMND